MGSANDDRDAATAELPSKGVGVKGGRCRGRNRHEVCWCVEPDLLDDLVSVEDGMFGGRQRREQWHRQLRELDQAAAAKPSDSGDSAVIKWIRTSSIVTT